MDTSVAAKFAADLEQGFRSLGYTNPRIIAYGAHQNRILAIFNPAASCNPNRTMGLAVDIDPGQELGPQLTLALWETAAPGLGLSDDEYEQLTALESDRDSTIWFGYPNPLKPDIDLPTSLCQIATAGQAAEYSPVLAPRL